MPGVRTCLVAEVDFLPEAEADYLEARAWYLARSPQAATGFDAAVDVALSAIEKTPEGWTFCDDRHRFYVLRRYPYSVIYRTTAVRVLVVAFAHSSRSATYWRDRG